MTDLDQLVMKTQSAAAGHLGVLSTGEALAAALVLNRADWLQDMGYTIAQALERIGPEWVGLLGSAASLIAKANGVMATAAISSAEESTLAALTDTAQGMDVNGSLVTYGNAPGYRAVYFTVDLERLGGTKKYRISVRLDAKDSASLGTHILDVHRLAWEGKGPIDLQEGERRPRWISPTI